MWAYHTEHKRHAWENNKSDKRLSINTSWLQGAPSKNKQSTVALNMYFLYGALFYTVKDISKEDGREGLK